MENVEIINDRRFGNLEDIQKSKYIKRTGTSGNYKYSGEKETGKIGTQMKLKETSTKTIA